MNLDDDLDARIWFLEFSPKQGYFHIDTLNNIMEYNRYTCYKETLPEYVIIEGPLTHQETAEAVRKHLDLVIKNSKGASHVKQTKKGKPTKTLNKERESEPECEEEPLEETDALYGNGSN